MGRYTAAQVWEEKLRRDWPKRSYFESRFMAENPSNDGQNQSLLSDSIIMNTDKLKGMGKGITATYGLRPRLQKGFVVSGTLLSGQEYRISDVTDSITVEELKLGVIEDSMLDKQAAFYDVVKELYPTLVETTAEAMDLKYFTALETSPTTTLYRTAGVLTPTATEATALAAITAADKFDPEMLLEIKPMLTTGFNRAQPPIQPIEYKGKYYWAVLVHPDALSDFEKDSTYASAIREAQVRGAENPLFNGATAIWNQFIIHSHENVSIGTSGAVPYSKGYILGRHALTRAFAQELTIKKKTVEYDVEQTAMGVFGMGAVKKAVFNSKDYGCVNILVARTQLSDKTYA